MGLSRSWICRRFELINIIKLMFSRFLSMHKLWLQGIRPQEPTCPCPLYTMRAQTVSSIPTSSQLADRIQSSVGTSTKALYMELTLINIQLLHSSCRLVTAMHTTIHSLLVLATSLAPFYAHQDTQGEFWGGNFHQNICSGPANATIFRYSTAKGLQILADNLIDTSGWAFDDNAGIAYLMDTCGDCESDCNLAI